MRNKDQALGFATRLRLGLFLLRVAVLTPIYNILWFLDELLYPGYRDCEFEGPVIVVGPPRAGTTFLHRSLAEDQNSFLGIRHLEWRFPFITLQKLLWWTGLLEVVKRISYWPSSSMGELARRMHDHTLGDYEEDGIFFEERFLYHYFVFRRFPYPGYMKFLQGHLGNGERAANRILDVHERILRKAIYLSGGKRRLIVLKENECMQMLRLMAKQHSKSMFILLTRRSADFLSSYVELSRVSTLCKTNTDPRPISEWHQCNILQRIRECELQIEFFTGELATERQVRLSFSLLTSEYEATMRYIYQRLGIPISESTLERIAAISLAQKKRQRGYELAPCGAAGFERYDALAEEVLHDHQLNLGHS